MRLRPSGRLLLYARANLAASGSRHVQLTTSDDEGVSWSPFQPIALRGHSPEDGADIYFFSAARNPADNGTTLLALFPMVQHFRGCICIAFSRDGLEWSAPMPLVSAAATGQRAHDQPAAGVIERGDRVDLYVHEGVPLINIDQTTPLALRARLRRRGEARRTELVRYSVPRATLLRWTQQALADLFC